MAQEVFFLAKNYHHLCQVLQWQSIYPWDLMFWKFAVLHVDFGVSLQKILILSRKQIFVLTKLKLSK